MIRNDFIRSKYDSVTCLSDLKDLVSDSKDGETPWLEFKAIRRTDTQNDKEFVRHHKSLLAKEICAFLNTSDGIIAWGIERSKDDGIKIVNDYNGNIHELFDGCIQTIVQPSPSGIDFKLINEDNKDALLIFIPKSNYLPHRVWGDAESKYCRNYYARSGTNSVALDEGIVRSLYLSDGRIPKISVCTEPKIESVGHISLNVLAKPDDVYYVDHYYDSEEFFLLDGAGQIIEIEEDGSLWTELSYIGQRINYPIYPSKTLISLFSNSILSSGTPESGTFVDGLTDTPSVNLGEDIRLSKEDFDSIKYIFTRSFFACDKVSLTTDKRLYILSSITYDINHRIKMGQKDFHFDQKKIFEEIEKKYGLKIYILNTFGDEDIIDDLDTGTLWVPPEGKLTLSYLDNLLGNYSKNLE